MKVRKISITSKLIIGVTLLFLVSDILLGIMAYGKSYRMMLDQIKHSTESIATCIAVNIDADLVIAVQPGEEDTEDYLKVSNYLTDYLNSTGVEYVYTIRPAAGGGMEYAVDSQIEDYSAIGDVFEDEEAAPALSGTVVSNSEPYTDEWGTHISGYSPIYLDGKVVAAVGVDVSMDWIREQTASLLRSIILLCAAVLVIGLSVLFVLGRALGRKFRTLNDKIEELTKGDGDLTKSIELNSGDEFEVIGSNINKLIDFIRGILLSINSESAKLNKSSSEIAENVRGARSDAKSISDTMTDMSDSMQETASSLNKINDLMTDITASFDEIVKEIDGGRDFANEVKNSASQMGGNARKERGETESRVSEIADSVSDKIERSKAVSRIAELTENIIGIADQTNLLALNASIESARAGEAGRGFAVVATEIGGLAGNSQSVASEIQNVSTEVINAVNELAEEAQNLLDFVDKTTMEGFENLVKTSEEYQQSAGRIADMMERFSRATGQIQTNIDSIRKSTDSVNLAVEGAAEGISKTAERTIVMTDNMTRIDEEALSSNEISNELAAEVGKFKLQN